MLYLHFGVKHFVHDIFNFHHSCIRVSLMRNPACFSLLCPIFNESFTLQVFFRNKNLGQIAEHAQSQNANLSGLPVIACYQKLSINCDKKKCPRNIFISKKSTLTDSKNRNNFLGFTRPGHVLDSVSTERKWQLNGARRKRV